MEDMLGLIFREPSCRALYATFSLNAVLKQVTTTRKFSYQIDVTLIVNLLDKVDDVRTFFTELESFGLRYSIFFLKSFVFNHVNRLDHHKSAGEFVFCYHNWIDAAFIDDSLDLVLVKLALEALFN